MGYVIVMYSLFLFSIRTRKTLDINTLYKCNAPCPSLLGIKSVQCSAQKRLVRLTVPSSSAFFSNLCNPSLHFTVMIHEMNNEESSRAHFQILRQ